MQKNKTNNFSTSGTFTRTALTAAITTHGELFYSMHQSTNNSATTKLFLSQLALIFAGRYPDSKSKVIYVLDNARYHKSYDFMQFIKDAGLQVLFLGPYSFAAAGIEKLFAFCKRPGQGIEKND